MTKLHPIVLAKKMVEEYQVPENQMGDESTKLRTSANNIVYAFFLMRARILSQQGFMLKKNNLFAVVPPNSKVIDNLNVYSGQTYKGTLMIVEEESHSVVGVLYRLMWEPQGKMREDIYPPGSILQDESWIICSNCDIEENYHHVVVLYNGSGLLSTTFDITNHKTFISYLGGIMSIDSNIDSNRCHEMNITFDGNEISILCSLHDNRIEKRNPQQREVPGAPIKTKRQRDDVFNGRETPIEDEDDIELDNEEPYEDVSLTKRRKI